MNLDFGQNKRIETTDEASMLLKEKFLKAISVRIAGVCTDFDDAVFNFKYVSKCTKDLTNQYNEIIGTRDFCECLNEADVKASSLFKKILANSNQLGMITMYIYATFGEQGLIDWANETTKELSKMDLELQSKKHGWSKELIAEFAKNIGLKI